MAVGQTNAAFLYEHIMPFSCAYMEVYRASCSSDSLPDLRGNSDQTFWDNFNHNNITRAM